MEIVPTLFVFVPTLLSYNRIFSALYRHPQSVLSVAFRARIGGGALFPECHAMLAGMPWHLRSTSDPEFFVPSQVNDHIRSQEASPWWNFMPRHRFQTGFFFLAGIFLK